MSGSAVKQLGESLFHYLHHNGRVSHLWLGYQKMEMFGHHHVADYDTAILLPGALQDTKKQVAALAAVKLRTAPITTAGYEVEILPTIPALQTSRRAPKVLGPDYSRL
jgi:hypothetical protein